MGEKVLSKHFFFFDPTIISLAYFLNFMSTYSVLKHLVSLYNLDNKVERLRGTKFILQFFGQYTLAASSLLDSNKIFNFFFFRAYSLLNS